MLARVTVAPELIPGILSMQWKYILDAMLAMAEELAIVQENSYNTLTS